LSAGSLTKVFEKVQPLEKSDPEAGDNKNTSKVIAISSDGKARVLLNQSISDL